MKKMLSVRVIVILLILGFNPLFAQEGLGQDSIRKSRRKAHFDSLLTINIDGEVAVHNRNDLKNSRPMEFQYVREADVMWSKTIWRIIDLREKMNHPLYYPEEPMGGGRKSLISVLMEGITADKVSAYEYATTGLMEFSKKLGPNDVTIMFYEMKGHTFDQEKSTDDSLYINIDPGDPMSPFKYVTIDTLAMDLQRELKGVKRYMVKELWFFDRHRSLLEVRIIGLAPIIEVENLESGGIRMYPMFWVYYPQARDVLAAEQAFSLSGNDAGRLSYDDIFTMRLFSSFIFQESNMFTNRRIQEYTLGREALIESERIKRNIHNFEQDMWEY